MKITFLGSSHGVPEPHRRCTCTLIEVDGKRYFIDMGMMPIEEMVTRGLPVESIQAIFITHMHGDHTNGLLHFADLLSWSFKSADPIFFLPDPEAGTWIEGWLRLNGSFGRILRFQAVAPGSLFNDGTLKVTALPTQHHIPSFAYLLEAQGKRVICTGDLKHPSADFPLEAAQEETHLLVCEAAHFDATDYLPLLRQCQVKRVCVHHHSPKHFASIRQLAAEMAPLPVQAAHDGLEITL